MSVKGLIFDLNGTLIDITTNESDDQVYRVTANFLDYYGVQIPPEQLKKNFFDLNRRQRHESEEEFPEFDSAKIFCDIIENFKQKPIENIQKLAETTSKVFRAASRYKLKCYDGVYECLQELKNIYSLSALSDGQTLWAKPEIFSVKLHDFFPIVLISGDFGYRKPDPRLFEAALNAMKLQADEVIFIGNDMYRDIYGAQSAGIKTIFFKSNQGDQEYHGAEADYIIYNIRELPKAIEFIQNKQKMQHTQE